MQNRITENRNRKWQNKLSGLKKADHSLWLIYKTVGGKSNPALIDTNTNTAYYTDSEKAEPIVSIYENILNLTYNSASALDEQMNTTANEPSQPLETNKHMTIFPILISRLIKKLPAGEAPGPDGITAEKLKNLPKESIVQICYIFKACILYSYFPKVWKTAKVHPVPKPGKCKTNYTQLPAY